MKLHKLIAFDLDGTLTEHRTEIGEENIRLLKKIQSKYKTVIVGAGTCDRILNQLRGFSIDIIGNYGLQTSLIIDGERVIEKKVYTTDEEKINTRIKEIRKSAGYTEYKGSSIEFHESGIITFPLLGTEALVQEKIIFDPDKEKRREIYSLVKEKFPEYTVVIGGSSSFDMMPKEHDKYKALVKYAHKKKLENHEILYVGDDFSKGGNDESIFKSSIECIEIEDYRSLSERLAFLL